MIKIHIDKIYNVNIFACVYGDSSGILLHLQDTVGLYGADTLKIHECSTNLLQKYMVKMNKNIVQNMNIFICVFGDFSGIFMHLQDTVGLYGAHTLKIHECSRYFTLNIYDTNT